MRSSCHGFLCIVLAFHCLVLFSSALRNSVLRCLIIALICLPLIPFSEYPTQSNMSLHLHTLKVVNPCLTIRRRRQCFGLRQGSSSSHDKHWGRVRLLGNSRKGSSNYKQACAADCCPNYQRDRVGMHEERCAEVIRAREESLHET
jgi:hypothetical protein